MSDGVEKYPEHAKLRAHRDRHATAVEFYDFLCHDKHLVFARYHEHDLGSDGCYGHAHDPESHCDARPKCGYGSPRLVDTYIAPADLIGEFLGIDPKKLEAEKRQMLDEIRVGAAT